MGWWSNLANSYFSGGWLNHQLDEWFQTWILCSISYLGCHPSHWRTYIFSRSLLHHQSVYMNIAQIYHWPQEFTAWVVNLINFLQFCASVAGCQTLWGTTVAMYPTRPPYNVTGMMVRIQGNYPKNSGSVSFLKYLICPDTVGAKHCETIFVFYAHRICNEQHLVVTPVVVLSLNLHRFSIVKAVFHSVTSEYIISPYLSIFYIDSYNVFY